MDVGRLPELIELLSPRERGVVITPLSSGSWRVGVVETYKVASGDDRYREEWATNASTLAQAIEAVFAVEEKKAREREASASA